MKKRTLLRYSIVLVLVLLIIVGGNAQALSQLTVYLPIVVNETPETPTPTTPPPSNPQLLNGYYEANLPNNGHLWFTVINNGTEARDGGFLFQVAPFCPWGAYSFGGLTVPISDGKFSFFVFDFQNREFIASLGCQSLSSNQATCNARQPMPGTSVCGGIEGVATRR
jgi:hypothetical protein